MRKTAFIPLLAVAIMIIASNTARANDGLPKSMLHDRVPADALEIAEAMKTAKVGDEIVLRGRITDGSDVFVPNRAIFRLADETAVPACCATVIGQPVQGGSACSVPANQRATIQFLDDRGQLLPTGLNGRHGLGVAKEVFIVGTVQQADNDKVLIINARKMHVPEANVPFGLFTRERPSDVTAIPETKKNAKAGDSITIRGRVGGSAHPFVDKRAVFTIVGAGPYACSDIEDDHCKTPWDYCCAPRDELLAHTATIQLVDDNGAPLRTDIKGRRGIRELSDLTVTGTVVSASRGALIVKAERIYIND